ncbi:MAG: M3 family metallopeptidase [Bdellovibrionota bacterium]
MSNPFINREVGPFNSIPFDKIQIEHFIPALKKGIEEGHINLKKIKEEKKPNFQNTIFALENVSELLDTVSTVYFNLHGSEAKTELADLAPEVSALCSNFSSDIFLDPDLFKQVKVVYESKENLDAEQKKLLENTYKSFVRNGALLDQSQKETLRKIDEELSQLSPKFSDNVLKSTNSFQFQITDESKLEGLPAPVRTAAKEAAEEKKLSNTWLFTLDAPSFIPYMKYAKDRAGRELMWKAYGSRCVEDQYSNKEVIKSTLELKMKRSKLLGFNTYADYVLEERMAQKPKKVIQFLEDLLLASKPAALRDLDEVKEFAATKDKLNDLKPWDFSYYSEQLQKEKYDFDEQLLKPFFSIDKTIQGVFDVASKLYQLKFTPNTNVSVYHPDVKVYEVHDSRTNDYIGLFYCDFFPRPTKKSGAWMTDYKKQGLNPQGKMDVPHVSIVCNFTKPSKDEPSLLTFDEVATLFHEFGHALHALLSKCTYKSLSGTNVYWDFVELPSQFMENFLLEKEVLDLFAVHYKTGEKIPVDLIEKLKKTSKFQAGYFCLRQLNFALLDMNWYTLENTDGLDVIKFENEATAETRLFDSTPGINFSCSFSHIFAGGYSAGYYSYKWAEVLDADAFEFFKEKGLFNPDVSRAFKENILSRGGTEHPMELYKKFRGREPDPKALLRRDGLI